jgi:hypothetical protein
MRPGIPAIRITWPASLGTKRSRIKSRATQSIKIFRKVLTGEQPFRQMPGARYRGVHDGRAISAP